MTIDSLLQSIVDEVRQAPGVQAVVLGGSRARGTHTPSSDIDLGIYYDPLQPPDLAALADIAARLDDEHRPDLLTPIGGWGPWINGGGWLKIQSIPVDFLYRNLAQVQAVIDDCLKGKVEVYYQPGHPLGFVTSMYLAEIAVCQPLWDPAGRVAALKSQVSPYPAALQQALIQKFAWEVDFSIGIAHKSIQRGDVAYAAGCCFRAVMCLLQALFALNHTYWLNEKGAVAMAEQFALKPEQFQSRVNEVFGRLSAEPQSIHTALELLNGLNADLTRLLPRNTP